MIKRIVFVWEKTCFDSAVRNERCYKTLKCRRDLFTNFTISFNILEDSRSAGDSKSYHPLDSDSSIKVIKLDPD